MMHKSFIFLCTKQHDTNMKSIIKAKTHQLQHFISRNSLLSCFFDTEAVINAFLKKFYLNLHNHYKAKIIPIIYT